MSCEREYRHRRRHMQEACGLEESTQGYGHRRHGSASGCGCHSPQHPEPGCTCGCHDRGRHGRGGYGQRCTCGCHDRGHYGRRCTCGCTCSCHDYERVGTCDCEEGLCGEDCTCPCHDVGFRRRFISRAERIAWLEEYLDALEAEAQGVRERIDELEAEAASADNEEGE